MLQTAGFRKVLSVFAAAVLVLAAVPSVQAAVKCVNTGGTGGCFDTVQKGVDAAAVGDTVAIAPGVYKESVIIATDGIKLLGKGLNSSAVVIDPYDTPNTGIVINAAGVLVKNLTVKNSGLNGINVNGAGVKLIGLRVTGIADYPIEVKGDNLLVQQCLIWGADDTGITGKGNGIKVRRTTVTQTDSGCINLGGDDILIEDSKIYSCEDDGAVYVGGKRSIIRRNAISQADGIGVEVDGDDAQIQSNTIKAVNDYGVDVVGINARISQNSVLHAEGDGFYVEGTGAQLSQNKVADARDYGFYVLGDNAVLNGNTASNIAPDPSTDDNGVGFYVSGKNAQVTNNTATLCSDYPFDVEGDSPVVTGNKASWSNNGIYVYCDKNCTGARVANNTSEYQYNDSYGIEIDANVAGMVVEGNTARGNADYGFDIEGVGIVVTRNTAKLNGSEEEAGFYLSGTGFTIEANLSTTNAGDGFEIYGSNHVVKNNTAKKNVQDGFYLGLTGVSADANLLEGNKALANGLTGIIVGVDLTNTTVRNNIAQKNRTDYCNEGTGTTETGNTFGTTCP
jgi:parallel beta-helix repeat protein